MFCGGWNSSLRLMADTIRATAPDHRLDISADEVIGQADLLEEIARVIGYDQIPDTIMADEMPPQRENTSVLIEERIRDILAGQGLYEVDQLSLHQPRERGAAGTFACAIIIAKGRLRGYCQSGRERAKRAASYADD